MGRRNDLPPPPRDRADRPRLRASVQSDGGRAAGGDRDGAAGRAGTGGGRRQAGQGVHRQPAHRHSLGGASGDRTARALRPSAARRGGDRRLPRRHRRAAAHPLSALPAGHLRDRAGGDRRPSPDGAADEETRDEIKAYAAATDNVGAFFGEDIFLAIGSIVLIQQTLEHYGIARSPLELAFWAIPTAVAAFFVHGARLLLLDRRLARRAAERAR
jgi:Protein of unknown function (DUF969)